MDNQEILHQSFTIKREFEKVITTIREKSDGLQEMLLMFQAVMEYEDSNYSNAVLQMECIAEDLCENARVLQNFLYAEK